MRCFSSSARLVLVSLLATCTSTFATHETVSRGDNPVVGVNICACQPATYEFILDFDLTCAEATVGGPGINDTACVVNTEQNQNVTDFRPVRVTTIQILELNQRLQVLASTPINGDFRDGDIFRYTSIIAQMDVDSIEDPNMIPKGLQITLAGRNAEEQDLVDFWLIIFDNECGVFPVVLEGQQIGWTIFNDLGIPPIGLCPAVGELTNEPSMSIVPSAPSAPITPSPSSICIPRPLPQKKSKDGSKSQSKHGSKLSHSKKSKGFSKGDGSNASKGSSSSKGSSKSSGSEGSGSEGSSSGSKGYSTGSSRGSHASSKGKKADEDTAGDRPGEKTGGFDKSSKGYSTGKGGSEGSSKGKGGYSSGKGGWDELTGGDKDKETVTAAPTSLGIKGQSYGFSSDHAGSPPESGPYVRSRELMVGHTTKKEHANDGSASSKSDSKLPVSKGELSTSKSGESSKGSGSSGSYSSEGKGFSASKGSNGYDSGSNGKGYYSSGSTAGKGMDTHDPETGLPYCPEPSSSSKSSSDHSNVASSSKVSTSSKGGGSSKGSGSSKGKAGSSKGSHSSGYSSKGSSSSKSSYWSGKGKGTISDDKDTHDSILPGMHEDTASFASLAAANPWSFYGKQQNLVSHAETVHEAHEKNIFGDHERQ